jgi:hypothetical protein
VRRSVIIIIIIIIIIQERCRGTRTTVRAVVVH